MIWPVLRSPRVRRGGSWRGVPRSVRGAHRNCDASGDCGDNLGLRLVRRVS